MKALLGIIFLLLSTPAAQADLLDRMRLEDTLRSRIENAFQLYDPKARVLLRFDYKNFTGTLPGTTIETRGEVNPYNIESADISRLSIEIYTDLENITAEAKELVHKVIPLEKSKINVTYKKIKTQFPQEIPPAHLDPQSLSTIARESMDSLSHFLGFLMGGIFLIATAFLFQQNSRKLKEFKIQVQLLSNALTERATSAPLPPPTMSAQASRNSAPTSPGDGRELKNIDHKFLKELFADCYWCQEDGYAHWLWKQLDSPQKTNLLAQWILLKDYSLSFVEAEPLELSYHEHPYYLDPLELFQLSQEDLCQLTRQELALWHFLSPMRQQNLPLTLEERLKAVQTKPDSKKPQFPDRKPSTPRTLEARISWGDLTSEDERSLFDHPDMVPVALREHIQSLVWLAQKEEAYIQKVLLRYDARSLASAWVGPEEVLKKLEAQLPEKKLKLLLTYIEKQTPTRHSEIYTSLVAEGLKNEAA